MVEKPLDVNALAERFGGIETYEKTCPHCGKPLSRIAGVDPKTHLHHPGACINPACPFRKAKTDGPGFLVYREPIGGQAKAPDMERTSRKNETVGYYLKYSVWSNEGIMAKDLHNFQADSQGQKALLSFAAGVVNQVVQGKTVHALIIGGPGVGKTHVANGILVACQTRSQYKLKTMFVDLQLLLSQRKTAMHSHPDVQAKVDETMRQIGLADVMVLDDLGAERGTDYDADLVKEIFRLREDKTTIMTTNMLGSQLKAMYDDRTLSRMAAHGQGNSFAVKGIADHRTEVKQVGQG